MYCNFGKNTQAFKDGIQFIVDEEDFEKYVKNKSFQTNIKGYVNTNNKGLHRLIMQMEDSSKHIDHIDGNPLNNQKSNLRVCTPQENAYNKNVYKNNKSGYTGVHFYKPLKKYMAYIKSDNKRKHLGYYETLEEAYTMYVRASQELHGDFCPDRIKAIKLEPLLEPKQKEYKSNKWSIENYHNNRDSKLRKQILRNIKKTGSKPKDSTIEKHNLTNEEIEEMLELFKNPNP